MGRSGDAADVLHLRGVGEHDGSFGSAGQAVDLGAANAVVGSLCKRHSSGSKQHIWVLGCVVCPEPVHGCANTHMNLPMLLETSGPTPANLEGQRKHFRGVSRAGPRAAAQQHLT